jgi:hypothetical protein
MAKVLFLLFSLLFFHNNHGYCNSTIVTISERYPLCSQLVTENRISEFGLPPFLLLLISNNKLKVHQNLNMIDNLYLDMNGIIHHCSHPDDDAQVRFSDEKIFLGVFNYIDQIFQVINPRKVFYMAVDGNSLLFLSLLWRENQSEYLCFNEWMCRCGPKSENEPTAHQKVQVSTNCHGQAARVGCQGSGSN